MSKSEIPFGLRTFEVLASDFRTTPGEIFRTFVLIAACSLSLGQRESEYLHAVKGFTEPQHKAIAQTFAQMVNAMEKSTYRDLLGPIHMELGAKSTRDALGEFYTPIEVSRMMAQMTIRLDEIPKDRPFSIMEPSSGAGQMVLCAAEVLVEQFGLSPLNMKATCVDVSRTACDMCFINLSLWGIPGVVIHGNTISLEQWGSWTTPTYHMARGREIDTEAKFMRVLAELDILMDSAALSNPDPIPTIEEISATLNKKGQYGFNFLAETTSRYEVGRAS